MKPCFCRAFCETCLSFSTWSVSTSNILYSKSLVVGMPRLRISLSLASVYSCKLTIISPPNDFLYASMVSLLPKIPLMFSGVLPPKKRMIGSSFTASLFTVSSLSEASFVASIFLISSMSSANTPIRSDMFCKLSFIFSSFWVYTCSSPCHSRSIRFRFLHLHRRMKPWLGEVGRTTR